MCYSSGNDFVYSQSRHRNWRQLRDHMRRGRFPFPEDFSNPGSQNVPFCHSLIFVTFVFFCDVSSLISEYVETFVVFMFQSLWIFVWYTYLNEQIAGQFPTSFFHAIVISEAAEAKPFPNLTNTFSNRLKQPTRWFLVFMFILSADHWTNSSVEIDHWGLWRKSIVLEKLKLHLCTNKNSLKLVMLWTTLWSRYDRCLMHMVFCCLPLT